MSPLKYDLALSRKAENDLNDIHLYTLQTWGLRQMEIYSLLLTDALETIRLTPSIGHKSSMLSNKHRVLTAGQHIIIYTLSGNTIFVSRILHEKMDASHQLKK